jgi:MFS family permease
MSALPHFLRALGGRNYRVYFAGQCVSLLGNWMTTTAALWLAYHLSGSPFTVGMVAFASQIPVLVCAPFFGVWVDRVDSLQLVRWAQVLAMAQSAALAVFTFSGHMTVPLLLGLCFVQGFINALDWPARQALVFRLAGDRAVLDNVIALNSITFNLCRLVGPAIGGLLIAAWGPGIVFALDAVSYLAVLAALAAVRLAPPVKRLRVAHPLVELRDAVRYAWAHPTIRRVLSVVPIIGLVGFAHTVLAPVFARDLFGGDARTLGFLLSATGAGSLAAGIWLSLGRSAEGMARVVAWGALIGGTGLAVMAAHSSLALALVCYGAAGCGAALVMVPSNTILQSNVDDDKRGRVMALFTMGQSLYPVGSLLIGALAEGVGPKVAVAVCGVVCIATAATFWRASGLAMAGGRHGSPP